MGKDCEDTWYAALTKGFRDYTLPWKFEGDPEEVLAEHRTQDQPVLQDQPSTQDHSPSPEPMADYGAGWLQGDVESPRPEELH